VHIHTQILIYTYAYTQLRGRKATEKVVKVMQEVFDCVFEPFTYIHMHTHIHKTAAGSKSHRKGD
jgi:hypothetical protein